MFCGQLVPMDATSVHCADPAVKDLVELSSHASLERISLPGTGVRSLNQLSNVGRVKDLYLHGTAFTDLSSLDAARWTSLERLSISQTAVADLAPLRALPRLKTLDVSGTAVADLSPLTSIASLTELEARDTLVTQLPALGGMPALEKLDIASTLVADLGPLRSAPRLKELVISYTLVEDVAPLAEVPTLSSVDATYTALLPASLDELRRRRPDLKVDDAPRWTGTLDLLRDVIASNRGPQDHEP